jgi:dGTPase
LLDEKELSRSVLIWRDASACVQEAHGDLAEESRRYFIIRCIIDDQVKDVVLTAEKHIASAKVKSADDVRLQPGPLVLYSPERRELNLQLRDYLYENLYFNPEVHQPNLKAVKMLGDLFAYFLERPQEIGELSRNRAEEIGWQRAICDYLAGMTDGYVHRTHAQIFNGSRSL